MIANHKKYAFCVIDMPTSPRDALTASCTWPDEIAQDANERARAALPALVEQRNNAMDAAALCQGDVAILNDEIRGIVARNWPHLLSKLPPPEDE